MTHYVIVTIDANENCQTWGPYTSEQEARDDWRLILPLQSWSFRGNLQYMRIIAVQQPMCYA